MDFEMGVLNEMLQNISDKNIQCKVWAKRREPSTEWQIKTLWQIIKINVLECQEYFC